MRTLAMFFVCSVVLSSAVVHAQTLPDEIATLIPGAAAADDEVGAAVSVSGDVAIVGARAAGTNFTGAATIYRRIDGVWQEEQHLVGNPNDNVQLFGFAVLIEGDTAFIGAPLFDLGSVNRGVVRVYEYDGSTWSLAQSISPQNPASRGFGSALDLSGDTLIVGEPSTMIGGPNVGAASIYRYEAPNWVPGGLLLRAAGNIGDQLGTSVAISGDVACVGAPGVDLPGINSGGAVTFFEFDGTIWNEGETLPPSSPSGGRFGFAVALDGSRAIVGADEADSAVGSETGSVSIYERQGTNWVLQQLLTPDDATVGSAFGGSIALHGDDLFVGARNQGLAGTGGPGAAYRYRSSGGDWVPDGSITAESSALGDDFGFALSYDGETLLVGAPLDDTAAGSDSGSARVIQVNSGESFVRGDANRDGDIDIADAVWIHNHLFPVLGPTPLPCELAADANDDEVVDLGDVLRILEWLFVVGEPPLAPPGCGTDPTPGALSCDLLSDCH